MEFFHLSQSDQRFPPTLRQHLGDQSPASITAFGNLDILYRKKLAIFCSVKCPGKLILQLYDAARSLRDAGVTVIGGFHSPMEKECLTLLVRGRQPVIICPARGLEEMRIPAGWKKPLDDGRLLLLSPFASKDRRVTTKLAVSRNEFVASLADRILVAYSEAGGKTDLFCRRVIEWQKPLFVFDCPEHEALFAAGAETVQPENLLARLGNSTAPTIQ